MTHVMCDHWQMTDGAAQLRRGAIDEHALGKELFNPSCWGGFQRRFLEGVERLSLLLLEKQSRTSLLGVGSHLFFKVAELCVGVPLILKFLLGALEDCASHCRVEACFSWNSSLVGASGEVFLHRCCGVLDAKTRRRLCLVRKKGLTLPQETC